MSLILNDSDAMHMINQPCNNDITVSTNNNTFTSNKFILNSQVVSPHLQSVISENVGAAMDTLIDQDGMSCTQCATKITD